jgi:hypothetical protein
MLVPEFRMLAISPVFSPKTKRQIKRTRSQMVTFDMASSRAVLLVSIANKKVPMRFPPLDYHPQGVMGYRVGLEERERRNQF